MQAPNDRSSGHAAAPARDVARILAELASARAEAVRAAEELRLALVRVLRDELVERLLRRVSGTR